MTEIDTLGSRAEKTGSRGWAYLRYLAHDENKLCDARRKMKSRGDIIDLMNRRYAQVRKGLR